MSKQQKTNISEQTQQEALAIAKANQKPGQTKEQTRLIAQGIEKGIAQYKKQQKIKSRAADKAKKQRQKQQAQAAVSPSPTTPEKPTYSRYLPWGLLLLSWAGFISYLFI